MGGARRSLKRSSLAGSFAISPKNNSCNTNDKQDGDGSKDSFRLNIDNGSSKLQRDEHD